MFIRRFFTKCFIFFNYYFPKYNFQQFITARLHCEIYNQTITYFIHILASQFFKLYLNTYLFVGNIRELKLHIM